MKKKKKRIKHQQQEDGNYGHEQEVIPKKRIKNWGYKHQRQVQTTGKRFKTKNERPISEHALDERKKHFERR